MPVPDADPVDEEPWVDELPDVEEPPAEVPLAELEPFEEPLVELPVCEPEPDVDAPEPVDEPDEEVVEPAFAPSEVEAAASVDEPLEVPLLAEALSDDALSSWCTGLALVLAVLSFCCGDVADCSDD